MAGEIVDLDNALAEVGQDIILMRTVGAASPIMVTCRATVNALSTTEVAAGVMATEYEIFISPTQINDAQWPGGAIPQIPPYDVDQSIPRAGVNDKIRLPKLNPKPLAITFVDTKVINGEVVRHNIRAIG